MNHLAVGFAERAAGKAGPAILPFKPLTRRRHLAKEFIALELPVEGDASEASLDPYDAAADTQLITPEHRHRSLRW